MVPARNLRITFSHRSAPAGTLVSVAGSRTSPAVWSWALWQVTQYLPMTAPAWGASETCARAGGEISAAAAAIVMKIQYVRNRCHYTHPCQGQQWRPW